MSSKKFKLSDVVSESGLQGLMQEEIERQKHEEAKRLATNIGEQFMGQVRVLRSIRQREKTERQRLKKMKKAIERFDENGDKQILRDAGFHM